MVAGEFYKTNTFMRIGESDFYVQNRTLTEHFATTDFTESETGGRRLMLGLSATAKVKTKNKSYIYLTLSPDKYLRNLEATDSNISNLHEWCKKWFDQDVRYYKRFAYVIESGSQGNHLHIHAVCEMITSHKHAQRLKAFWKRYFPNNQLLLSGKKTGNEYHSMRFDTEEIWQDKLEYFVNEKKGTHENLVDLGLRGSRGVSY